MLAKFFQQFYVDITVYTLKYETIVVENTTQPIW